jgi:hypothetical protein
MSRHAIKVPDRISRAIFELPIVKMALKAEGKIFYRLRDAKQYDGHGNLVACHILFPGDWVVITKDCYMIYSDHEYQKMREE